MLRSLNPYSVSPPQAPTRPLPPARCPPFPPSSPPAFFSWLATVYLRNIQLSFGDSKRNRPAKQDSTIRYNPLSCSTPCFNGILRASGVPRPLGKGAQKQVQNEWSGALSWRRGLVPNAHKMAANIRPSTQRMRSPSQQRLQFRELRPIKWK